MAENHKELNLEATELRLGLPGTQLESLKPSSSNFITGNKRTMLHTDNVNNVSIDKRPESDQQVAPPSKAQVVGWPPVRSYHKNCLQQHQKTKKTEAETALYVKVSMDGAPYLRKIDLNVYKGYPELLHALEDMFKFKVGVYCVREGYNGSEYVPTYEDKDGDWMLVGDVPWDMFTTSCKRMRIMKATEAKGFGLCPVKFRISTLSMKTIYELIFLMRQRKILGLGLGHALSDESVQGSFKSKAKIKNEQKRLDAYVQFN